MGPGLALIDATLDGDIQSVRLLRATFGNTILLASAAEVCRRAIGLREEFDEYTVQELHHVHLASRSAYDEFVIRKRDRFRAASPALRAARATITRLLRHWLRSALAENDKPMPAAYRPNPLIVKQGLNHTFGIAYAATMTFVHLATTSGRDEDELLDEYRAKTAGEQYAPPGAQPAA